MRPSKRAADEMRKVTLERGVVRYAEGSCMVSFGETKVLCAATVEEKGPPWLRGTGKGWVTAEYSMLPRATHERTRREVTSVTVVLVSWLIASVEYAFQVPANRLGYGMFSGYQLKIIQEAITLTVFAVFAWLYLGETMRWNHALACMLLFGAVAAAFWKP